MQLAHRALLEVVIGKMRYSRRQATSCSDHTTPDNLV